MSALLVISEYWILLKAQWESQSADGDYEQSGNVDGVLR
jgi:hypothetical protein